MALSSLKFSLGRALVIRPLIQLYRPSPRYNLVFLQYSTSPDKGTASKKDTKFQSSENLAGYFDKGSAQQASSSVQQPDSTTQQKDSSPSVGTTADKTTDSTAKIPESKVTPEDDPQEKTPVDETSTQEPPSAVPPPPPVKPPAPQIQLSRPELTKEELSRLVLRQDEYVERFIPITRRSLIQHLVQHPGLLTSREKVKFDKFFQALDSAVVTTYHGTLTELKALFDPLNPDKDTISTRQWNRKERAENEFWLMQKLAIVMEKANFHELPKPVVEVALQEHQAGDGVMVRVDATRYDILRFWALGKEIRPPVPVPLAKRLVAALGRLVTRSKKTEPQAQETFKRLVVAVRHTKDGKLTLKAFKDIPINALEQVLPEAKVRMSQFDQAFLYFSVGITSLGMLIKLVTVMAEYRVNWSLIVGGVFGLIAARTWSSYKNRHMRYLAELSKTLYYRNIANNRGLLTLLVDRAEDESVKETLLVYTFLLSYQSVTGEASTDAPGGAAIGALEKDIEKWVLEKTGSQIRFHADEAVQFLSSFGILKQESNLLSVVPLDTAIACLPWQPVGIDSRSEEFDVEEGYDRREKTETAQPRKKWFGLF
ncbi:TMEM143 [Branchiostoma lanceolatum]|uniref:TMEM143 protein n=1 Tax=Branchiostoma lanceolatum TaxID=7740 RepID=A0A8J9VH01_BRALA|nr:TMEM143 [Branchiostoma lanceolatum]